jgi:hypothetical protein
MELMESKRLRLAGEAPVIHHDVFRFLQPLQLALDGPIHLIIVPSNPCVLASP